MDLVSSPGLLEQARTLCRDAGFRFAGSVPELKSLARAAPGEWAGQGAAGVDAAYVLFLDADGLSLCQRGKGAAGPVRCDFAGGGSRHRRLYGGGKSQAIAKAVGIKDKIRPTVADLTAGLGGDAFVLAGLGCRVIMVERHPVVRALLADGLARARLAAAEDAELGSIVERLALYPGDARQWLEGAGAADTPDVIYLDPMFPERRKSALVNKTMQAFQHLVGDDADADLLLPLALAKAKHRVVVKRPAHAPWLDDEKPGYALKGKSVRFDIYPLRALASPAGSGG